MFDDEDYSTDAPPAEQTSSLVAGQFPGQVDSSALEFNTFDADISEIKEVSGLHYEDQSNAFGTGSYHPQDITPELQEKHKRDHQIESQLQQKRQAESQLKEQRKLKGKEDLQRLVTETKRQAEAKKTQNRVTSSKQETESKIYTNVWQKVVENINLKEDGRGGAGDVKRMKEAIVRRSHDIIKQ